MLTYQKGSASIEFAFSFVMLMALLYGIVGYTMPLLMSASYQQLASDTLREGLVWQRYRQASDVQTQAYVATQIGEAWMPTNWAQPCLDTEQFLTIDPTNGVWEVCVRHPAPSSILPPIKVMGWEFPTLPEQIVGFATMHTREVTAAP
ncbi:MAG: TadE/TadG family type IV pilus assembly protein [Halomonas sp.]|uniref:TadE/TadG family type IV pilus assembly protein n=1 Tax=Halomonas sp. TaxID=1486246 RepID=UPI003F917ED1